MPSDNTLGAPTEGLGQTVTFTAKDGEGVPQTTAMQRGALKNDFMGGGALRTAQALQIQAPVGQDALTAALFKMGAGVFKERLEAENTLKFAEGMQKAAQGQAIEEIVNEQPWYSKLFGSTSLVDGARAYTASNLALSTATEFEKDMPELRKLSANEMAKVAADRLSKASSTGDPTTNAMVIQQFSRELPGVLKQQAKAHLRYQQEVLETSMGDSVTATGSRLQSVDVASRGSSSTVDPADVVVAQQGFMQSLIKPPEMDKAAHEKLVTSKLMTQIYAGNFAVFHTLEDSGYLASQPAEVQSALRRAHQAASNEARGKMPIEFLEEQAAWLGLSRDPTVSKEDIIKGRQALQDKYTAATGDRSQIVSNATTVQEFQQLQATQERERDQLEAEAKRAAAPENKKLAEIAVYQHDVGRMLNFAEPYYIGHLATKDRQATLDHLAATQPQDVRMKVLVQQADMNIVDKTFQNAINAGVNAALRTNDPVLLKNVYEQQVLPLIKAGGDRGIAVALAYADKDVGDVLARYHEVAQGNTADASTIGLYYSHAVLPQPAKMDSKTEKEVVASIASGTTGSFFKATGRMFGGDSYPVENAEAVAGWLKPYLSPAIKDVDTNVTAAKARAKNLSIIGGYGWMKSESSKSLTDYYAGLKAGEGVPPDQINRATREHIDMVRDQLKLEGDIQIGQDRDAADGSPRLFMIGTDSSGKVRIQPFTGAEIATSFKGRWYVEKKPLDLSTIDTRNLGKSALEQALEDKRKFDKANKPK